MFEATKEQIDSWKESHGEVFEFIVGDARCYLRKPNRKILGLATSMGQKSPMKFNEIVLQNCWLDGDMKIQRDDDYFLAISAKLDELMQLKAVEVKKH